MNKHVMSALRFATIEGRVLAEALKPISFVIERRNTYPILGMVKLEINGATLRVTGTDLDVEVITELDLIDSAGDWSICIDSRLLGNISRAAAVAPVRIDLVEQVGQAKKGETPVSVTLLHVTIGDDIRYEVANVLAPDSFPALKGTRGDLIEHFGNGRLADLLRKTSWCVSTEETRYYLNGVCWQMGQHGHRFVATDGHRLALCRYDAEPTETFSSRIIPRKTVLLLQRFFAGKDISIFARHRDGVDDQTGIEAVAGRTTIRSKLIEGTFPDVDRVIPKDEPNHRFLINRQELVDAISMAMVMTSDRGGRALEFAPGPDDHITIGLKNAETGTAKVRLSAPWPEAAPSFGFNGRYLSELLAQCDGEVSINQKDSGAPFIINDGDETMTRVLMPMRV